MATEVGATAMVQGRMLGRTSAVDASVMPTIPSGYTYLGCVIAAERIARKMKADSAG